ncbi:hypothetical protein C1I95_07335 [Micromonospora craterilacus]|uniref:Uncharacterized protein n=1 Tax=Micromonospora craterilacus TaxID=1655439 RepID=A0A2W2EYY3_9ACTN|nr:hypothetical protein C1I95_07335 [Micromonospora craterilacus]
MPHGSDRVELAYADARATLAVVASPTPLSPSDIVAVAGRYPEPCLIIVPAATSAAREAVEATGGSWLVDSGQHVAGVLHIDGTRIVLRPPAPAATRPTRRGRVPWGAFTLVRRMIQQPHATQRELAALAGVSQPRVSQVLTALADIDVVRRAQDGWTLQNVDAAIDWWLSSYPGPGGITTYWFGLRAVVEQAARVASILAAAGVQPVAVSGDVAADLLAPWRAPARAVVYAADGADLAEADLVPAGPEEATIELTVPHDPGLWPTASQTRGNALPLADPLQILWDVMRAPGADSEEAAERVRQVLRRRHEQERAA